MRWKRREVIPAILAFFGLGAAQSPVVDEQQMDVGDFPRLPDGSFVISATSPIDEKHFSAPVVYVLPDEWRALVLARAVRLGQIA